MDKLKKIFGTSGVRGESFRFLSPQLAYKLGLTFAHFLNNQGKVIVGRDLRLTSHALKSAVTAGLLAGGIDVIDAGETVTPAVLHALKKLRVDGAVSVTGSHTPPEINGLLFFMRDTSELHGEEQRRFEEIFHREKCVNVPWIKAGVILREDVTRLYFESVMENLKRNSISGYKVVLDPGNGSASMILEALFEKLGIEVETINSKPDPFFSSRDPYPRKENLKKLAKKVVNSRADIGLAVDGDGDRAVFIDEKGTFIDGDVAGVIFSVQAAKEKGKGAVICPINTSKMIEEALKGFDVEIVYTKIGPPQIVGEAKKRREETIFAFEETGKFIWPNIILYGDAAISLGKMIEILNVEDIKMSSLVEKVPKLYRVKKAYPCTEEGKYKELQEIMLKKLGSQAAEKNFLDGLKITFKDQSWILVRPSGTEPVIRCYIETKDKEKLKKLEREADDLIKKTLNINRKTRVQFHKCW